MHSTGQNERTPRTAFFSSAPQSASTETRTNHIRTTRKTSHHTANRGRYTQTCVSADCNAPYKGSSLHSNGSAMPKFDCHYSQNNVSCSNMIGTANNRPLRQSRYNTAFPSDNFAQGELINNGLTTQRQRDTEKRAWKLEIDDQQEGPKGVSHTQSDAAVTKSSLPYRAVLAKKGFLVKDTLGAGSYSKVKHASYVKHVDADHPKFYPDEVAVKIIDRTIAPKDFQQKFLPRELDIWPRLHHPNIVRMMQCFSEGQRVYMILEYVEGGDALKFIQTAGAVTESTGKLWTSQVRMDLKHCL